MRAGMVTAAHALDDIKSDAAVLHKIVNGSYEKLP
jgi:hypothetical protein